MGKLRLVAAIGVRVGAMGNLKASSPSARPRSRRRYVVARGSDCEGRMDAPPPMHDFACVEQRGAGRIGRHRIAHRRLSCSVQRSRLRHGSRRSRSAGYGADAITHSRARRCGSPACDLCKRRSRQQRSTTSDASRQLHASSDRDRRPMPFDGYLDVATTGDDRTTIFIHRSRSRADLDECSSSD